MFFFGINSITFVYNNNFLMKLRKIKILLLFIIISTVLFANKIDSLERVINTSSGDEKITALLNISKEYYKIDYDTALFYANQAYIISKKTNNNRLKISSINEITEIYYYKSDYKNAIKYTRIVLEEYKKDKKNLKEVAVSLQKLGAFYFDWDVYDKALEYFFEALKIYKELGLNKNIASVNNNIGLVYKESKKYDLAIDFLSKSVSWFKNSKETQVYSYSLNNLGGVYSKKAEYDSALFYFKKSIAIKIKSNDDLGLANTYGNMGDMYYDKTDYDNALKYYKKVLFISERQKNDRIKAMVYVSLGKTYYELKFNEVSIEYLQKSEKYAEALGINNTLKEIYEFYSKVYFSKNDFKTSNFYLKKYIAIKDSLFSKEKSDKLSELMVLYNMEAKNQEIKTIKERDEANLKLIEKANDFKYFMIISIILILVISFLIFSRFKSKINNTKTIKEKNNQIASINKQLIGLNSELEQKIQHRTKELEDEIQSKLQIETTLSSAIEKEKRAIYLKDFFLSNISHEIRTPLNAISGLASLLERKFEGEKDSVINEFINGIIQNSNRLLSLLNNIIDFSRLEANDIIIKKELFSINDIVSNVCELHRFKINDKKLNLETNFQDIPTVISDKENLAKIVNDIIDNAVRYTDNGTINIETGYYSEYEEVYIRIKDTGQGIDSEFLPHIFASFTQDSKGFERKYQGMGLGLPLAKRLIELMTGRIEISSKKDKGTIVSLFIPANISRQEKQVTKTKTIAIPDEVFRKKDFEIFVVEDDYFNKLVLHTLLERIAKVTSASTGEEALELITKRINDGKEFDIMLIDINLPDGWDGIKLMDIIKEKWPIYKDVIFIAQTAYSDEKDKKTILNAGFSEFITKPIDGETLINMIKFKLMQ